MLKPILIAGAIMTIGISTWSNRGAQAAEELGLFCPSSSFYQFKSDATSENGWTASVQTFSHFQPIWKASKVEKREDGTYQLTCSRHTDVADFVVTRKIAASNCTLNQDKGGFLCIVE